MKNELGTAAKIAALIIAGKLAGGCANYSVFHYDSDSEATPSEAIEWVEEDVERIVNNMVLDDAVIEQEEFKGLETTIKELGWFKEDDRLQDKEYQTAIANMVDAVKKVRAYFKDNAQFEKISLAAQYALLQGDNAPIKTSRGFKRASGYSFVITRDQITEAFYGANKVTEDDKKDQTDKYKAVTKLADNFIKSLLDKAQKDFVKVSDREGIEKYMVRVSDAVGKELMEQAPQWQQDRYNGHNGGNGIYTLDPGSQAVRAYEAKAKLGDKVNQFRFNRKTTPRTGK